MGTQKALNWVIALAGLWELIAAFVLGHSGSAAALWDAIIIGVVWIVLGGWAAMSNQLGTIKTLDWINVCLGVWLVIAPFLLGYSALTTPLWNDVIVGIVVIVLAGWALYALGHQSPGPKVS